ncbi:alkaline phosphatase PhoX [Enhygromyxa salina]|nr:alkaline phosphatase PhoX [Enhygromyxa salina]
MGKIGRRKFLVTGGSAALAFALISLARRREVAALGPLGALVPDPDQVLDLPEGFQYEILESKGEAMDDRYRVPGRPSGMACFPGSNGTLILMRNHEVSVGDHDDGPYAPGQDPSAQAYETAGMGGVTRLVIDASSYARISSNLVLVGTARNAGGGVSPWGWLSCESDTEIGGGVRHGYVFRCPADAAGVKAPQRVDGYGRFRHAAACVDPSNNYVYLTENRTDSCLYRFVPNNALDPFTGTLQALAVVNIDGYETDDMSEDQVLEIHWVTIAHPDPDADTVREQGHSKGAARFVRGEGIWFHEGQVYFCARRGGEAGIGQIFRLIDGESKTLELILASSDAGVLDSPDALTVAPWGDVFMSEDGDGDQYIRWIDGFGAVRDFARNAKSSGELSGVCFSPDAKALFVNMQADGLTLVITGPFPMVAPEPGDGGGDDEGDGGDEGDGEGSGEGHGDGDGDGDDQGADEGESGADESGDFGDELGEDGDAGDAGDAGSGPYIDYDRARLGYLDDCNCTSEAADDPGLAIAGTVAAALAVRAHLVRPDES